MSDDQHGSGDAYRRLTRREILQTGSGAALLLGAGSLVGADKGEAALRELFATPKRGGTITIGIGGGGPTDDFDAVHVNGPSATTRTQIFYETVAYLNGNFALNTHNLADEFTPNATADKWTIRLKQGIEFHNGKTLTADDLLFSVKRIVNPKNAATAAGQLKDVDFTRTKKLDNRTVQFVLNRPYSFFDYLMSDIVYMTPVGYNPRKPVSTGPWKLISYSPGRRTVLGRFENYWGTPAYADRLIILEIPDDSARVNALISGQVDAINQVPFAQMPVLKGRSSIRVVSSPTGGWNPITMRTDIAPFNDVRVRQAIRLVFDRKQAIATALYGQGTPAADHYGRFDPCYDPSLVRNRDVDQARSLLKKAGREGLKVELTTTTLAAGSVEACQVLAENAKAAGMQINLKKVDISTFFGGFGKWPFAIDYWPGLPYLVVASLADGPRTPFNTTNVTHFRDAKFNALYNQAAKQLDEKKRCEIVAEMQRIQYERGGYIIWSFGNSVDAYSKKIGGVIATDKTGWGLGRCQLHKLYVI